MNVQVEYRKTLEVLEMLTEIKAPKLRRRKHSPYPFDDIGVDASFLVPCLQEARQRTMASLNSCIWRRKQYGKLFVQKAEAHGIRVTRVK